MKHKISKLKIKSGKDANKMLIRKLVRNFAEFGRVKTTETKAKFLKSQIESFAHSALSYNEAVKNIMLPFFITEKKVLAFVDLAKKHAKNGTGSGIVRIKKHGLRYGDAAPIAEVVWTHAEEPKVEKEKSKKAIKEEKKSVDEKKSEKVETSKTEEK